VPPVPLALVLFFAVCAAALFLRFAVPLLVLRSIIGRSKTRTPPSYPESERDRPWFETPGLPLEQINIKSADGLALGAYYVKSKTAGRGDFAHDVVILAHGYRGGAKLMGHYGRLFYEELGCNVLLPDARAHGLSGGAYIGFGWPERFDILRWIEWAKQKGAERIVLFGVSMGAATVMMAAGENPPAEVKAVIEDCGYTSAADEIRHVFARYYHLAGYFGRWLFDAVSKPAAKKAGYTFEEASAIGQLKKVKVPVLFIHGEDDNFVPFEMALRLYGAYSGEKELYTVKDAGHGFCLEADREEYAKRVVSFVKKYF
jgi:fermentation-respiration switch protein FrsA (DUF1100 family)